MHQNYIALLYVLKSAKVIQTIVPKLDKKNPNIKSPHFVKRPILSFVKSCSKKGSTFVTRQNKKLLHKRLLRVKTKPTKSSGKIVGKCIAAEDKKI